MNHKYKYKSKLIIKDNTFVINVKKRRRDNKTKRTGQKN